MRLINNSEGLKKEKHLRFISLIVSLGIILISTLPGNAQSVPLSREITAGDKDSGNGIPDRLFQWNDLEFFTPNAGLTSGNYSSGKERADSVYEIKNFGYGIQHYKWYYYYNPYSDLDSSIRLYFNGDGQYENVMENRTYDDAGHLLRLVRTQPVYSVIQYYSTDSTLIDGYVEEYKYENGNYVQKSTINLLSAYIADNKIVPYYDTAMQFLTYDADNRLTSLENKPGFNVVYYYYYDDDNLKYIVNTLSGAYYTLIKYDYASTDSTRITTVYRVYYDDLPRELQLDTVSYWRTVDQYTENYDDSGMETSLVHKETFNLYSQALQQDYKIEYTHNTSKKVLHASYYNWQTKEDTAVWSEVMRIDNTYDDYNNLVDYRKTYWDERTSQWEIDEGKTYYYSSVQGVLGEKYLKYRELGFYPNPSVRTIKVNGLDDNTYCYLIFNLSGIPELSGRLETNNIDISALRPGMYIVEINGRDTIYTGKFIKK